MNTPPRPIVNRENQFFWDAIARGQLVVQECAACGELRYPPLPSCPECLSLTWHERELTGRGSLFSYVIPRRPIIPYLDDGYIVALVALEEGPRIVTNLVDVDAGDVSIGMPLEVCFQQLPDGGALPQFRPRSSDSVLA